MSDSSRTTLGEGGDVSRQAYVLFLTPPPPASAEERSTTESQESEITPLTPTHENLPLDGQGGRDRKAAHNDDSYHGRMSRVGRDADPRGNPERETVVWDILLGWCGGSRDKWLRNEGHYSQPNLRYLLRSRIAYYDSELTRPGMRLRDAIDQDRPEFAQIQLTRWPDERDPRARRRNELPYDLDFKTYDQWRESRPEFEVRYADKCEAFLIGRSRKITFDCYDLESDSVSDIAFVMRWAIAYAVNSKLRDSKSDGVLGLSLSDHQKDGRMQRVPYPEGDSLVMYFTVRPHPKYHPGKRVQSWVAFNQWPAAEMPSFSKKIPVHPSTYRNNWWSVTLLRIEFQWLDERHDSHRVIYYDEYKEGLEVLVDSGSSTSDLPYKTVDGIHREVFGGANPVPERASRRDTYDVPSDFPVHLYRVRLVFKGDRGRENVVVYAPFKHFVCERDLPKWPDRIEDCPFQGVIFAAPRHIPFGVLGLNFFQTMFISFNKAFDGVHYLRMAPQEEDVEMYELRYPSDSD
ncbi:hypothetical protein V8D89_002286 [Ganoderma adspersum]